MSTKTDTSIPYFAKCIGYNYIWVVTIQMYEKMFSDRLTKLRLQKGVSARDMSLSIGQSESYINKIENGVSLPSMSNFFYICEYLGITPAQFFEDSVENPETLQKTLENLKHLSAEQLAHINTIIEDIKG